jgi:hypothetical protein
VLQVGDLFLGRVERSQVDIEGAVSRDDFVDGGGGGDGGLDLAAVADDPGFCVAWSMSCSVMAATSAGSKS